jgi:nucleoside-diphosphate-sugar epimerase
MAIDPASTKILVTGANGFIGLHTVLHFLKSGYTLCATTLVSLRAKKASISSIAVTSAGRVHGRRLSP